MLTWFFAPIVALFLFLVAVFFVIYSIGTHKKIITWIRGFRPITWVGIGVMGSALIAFVIFSNPYPMHFAMPPFMHSQAPGHMPASIPVPNIFSFFANLDRFERIANIATSPSDVPSPIQQRSPQTVKVNLLAKEVVSEITPGVFFNYWTYNGQVPGPMLRARVGDTVELSLANDESSLHAHNIDLHAVTGPGGGAVITNVLPGETKTFSFKALQPGLYEYHCAMPNVSTHNAHGQYGLILIEPSGGLTPVDHEFYFMQGEFYTTGGIGKRGLVAFDADAFLAGNPTYIPFNGKIEQSTSLKINAGDSVRIFFGNGGVNLISSFHVIGEIFDSVYPDGGIGSDLHKNIQTVLTAPGGSAIVEFVAEVPGKLVLVDHALARMNKGAWATIEVEGEARGDIFAPVNTSGMVKE